MFVAYHATVAMFARDLPPLEVKGIAIAETGGIAKHADRTGFLDPSQLYIVGNY